jgi:DMSO/TMAO reductase YedYZ heme-binding membrane subunit
MSAARGRFEGGRMLATATLALVSMTALVVASAPDGEQACRALIRATARTSVTLFLAAFLASSLRRLWPRPITAWLLRNRRPLALSFALSHAIHGAAIVALATQYPSSYEQTDLLTRYGGGFGFLVVAALAATSSDAAQRRLGMERWRTLHRFGAWYVFALFLLNYGPAVFFDATYAPASVAVWGALAIRIAAWRRATRATGTSSPPAPARSA